MKDEPKGLTLHHLAVIGIAVMWIIIAIISLKSIDEILPLSEHVAELRWEELR